MCRGGRMRALGLAVFLVSILGCPDGQKPVSQDGHCGGNTRCPSELSCALPLGACVEASTLKSEYGIQAIPPKGSGLLTEQWVIEDSEQEQELLFPSPQRVSGVIKELGNPLAPSLPAQIMGESPGLIPGTVLSASARAIEGVNEDFEAFEMQIIPERTYRFFVFPDDESRPPQVDEKVFDAGESDYLISLPAKEGAFAYPRVVGKLMTPPASGLETDDPSPAQNAVVFARQSTQVNSQGGDSTQATPETKLGGFELRVPPGAGQYRLWATSVIDPEEIEPIVPLTSLEVEKGDTVQVAGEFGEVKDIGTLMVNPRPLTPVLIRVETMDSRLPIDKASIHLSASLSANESIDWYGVSGSFSPGVWQGLIPPGDYVIDISPPRSSGMARTRQSISVALDSPEWTFQVNPMTRVTGTVSGWGGQLLPNANLLLIQLDSPLAPPVEARASAQGEFEVALSPGQYKTLVIPAAGSKVPRFTTPPFTVGEITSVSQALQGPIPHLIQGQMLDPEGTPLPNAHVEVYRLDKGAEGILLHEAIQGEGTTDENGQFQLLVPSEEGIIVESEGDNEE